MYLNDHYVINWDKVGNIDDLKRILKEAHISFNPFSPAVNRLASEGLLKLQPK